MNAAVRIGTGVYRVEHDDRQDLVYVAGRSGNEWAFWNGDVFRRSADNADRADRPDRADHAAPRSHSRGAQVAQLLTPPMPATVIKVLVAPGATVRKGDTLILLEAMKMELPVRADADAVVAAIHCREGERVEAGAVLLDLQ